MQCGAGETPVLALHVCAGRWAQQEQRPEARGQAGSTALAAAVPGRQSTVLTEPPEPPAPAPLLPQHRIMQI